MNFEPAQIAKISFRKYFSRIYFLIVKWGKLIKITKFEHSLRENDQNRKLLGEITYYLFSSHSGCYLLQNSKIFVCLNSESSSKTYYQLITIYQNLDQNFILTIFLFLPFLSFIYLLFDYSLGCPASTYIYFSLLGSSIFANYYDIASLRKQINMLSQIVYYIHIQFFSFTL